MKYRFITIEGNIGSGKTSLATKLTNDLNGKLILEEFADNPFLPKFYDNPGKYAFPLELFFMAERFKQLQENIANLDLFTEFTVTDYIFIKSLLFAKVTLPEDEFKLYSTLFNIINPKLPQPELLVYLHAPVSQLLENIKKRGRIYEQQIPADYLQNIQQAYFDFFKTQNHLKVLVFDTQSIDFVHNPNHYQTILDLMNADYEVGVHYMRLEELV